MFKCPAYRDPSAKTSVLSLIVLVVAACLMLPQPSWGDAERTLSFTNNCSFDVWLNSVGSNASVIPCTPSSSSAQANCPADFICYAKNTNTNYCVPGTTTATSFPVTNPAQIDLNGSKCLSGTVDTETGSNQWGQCTCRPGDSGSCPAAQVCLQTADTYQCYWGYSFAGGNKLKASGGTATLKIDASLPGKDTIVASGKFFAQASCGVNDHCLSDNVDGAPATMIEYTFQNNNDWYDVSYINGINLPAVMYPEPSKTLDYEADDPYRCMAAGADEATIETILAFQKKNGIKGNSQLKKFACTNDYSSTFTGNLTGFNAVYSKPGALHCTSASDCGDLTCGLSVANVKAGLTDLTCGNRIGYWTYAQFCALNKTYQNATLGIDCADPKKLAYSQCVNQAGVSDQGPGRSCFNSNTTFSGDTCCGYETWSSGGASQPMAPGDAAVSGVKTNYWKTNILPAVKRIKDGCYLAYSYQYDDPFSTFTCATKDGKNSADYNIVLCQGGNDAGIDPPPPPSCTATVPGVYTPNEFTVGVPAGHALTIDGCTGGSCTSRLNSVAHAIYAAESQFSKYQFTATNTSSGTKEVCFFTIPQSGCIERAGGAAQCKHWVVAPDGAWKGRSVGVPAFP